MWRAAAVLLLVLALAAPCVSSHSVDDHLTAPPGHVCAGSLSSRYATTLLISTVVDNVVFEAPTLLSEVRASNAHSLSPY